MNPEWLAQRAEAAIAQCEEGPAAADDDGDDAESGAGGGGSWSDERADGGEWGGGVAQGEEDDEDEEESDADEGSVSSSEEADEGDAAVGHAVVEAIGALLRTHGCAYLRAAFAPLVAAELAHWVHPECLHADQRIGLFLACDVLEFCGDEALACVPLDALVRNAVSRKEDLRQAACFGLGVAALTCSGGGFAPYLSQAVAALTRTVAGAGPSGGSGADSAHDNAVTALAKIADHQLAAAEAPGAAAQRPAEWPPRASVLGLVLSRLPLDADSAESRAATHMLCAWLQARDADVLGPTAPAGAPDARRLSAALRALAAPLLSSRLRGDDVTLLPTIAATLRALQAHTQPQILAAVWGGLEASDREALAAVAAADTAALAAAGAQA